MLSTARTRLRDSRGFTLVEVLVALVTGMAVSMALFAILEVSSHQTTRISEVAQATAVSRSAMTHIVDELHSACLSNGFTPVKTGSGPNKLVFVNGYFPEENVKKEAEYSFVRKDVIEYSSGAKTLTDTTYKATGEESSGEYPWKESSKVTLGEKIEQVEPTKENPIFKYYEYNTSSSTGTSEAASTLKAMTGEPESEIKEAATAKKVAAVAVTFRTLPYKKEQKLTTASESNTPVAAYTMNTFAFSAPNSESTIEAGPCE